MLRLKPKRYNKVGNVKVTVLEEIESLFAFFNAMRSEYFSSYGNESGKNKHLHRD